MNSTTTIDDARYVKAMSHPLRVTIMALLEERSSSPVELARNLDASLGTVAYHVRTLHRLGLIDLVDETPVRGSIQHHYRVRQRPQISDEAWAAAPPIARQVAVRSSLQLINEYVRLSAESGGFDRAEAHLARTRLKVDREGWRLAAQACARLLDELDGIEAAAAERLESDPHAEEVLDAGIVTMFFEAARLSQTGTARRDGAAAAPAHADGASAAQH